MFVNMSNLKKKRSQKEFFIESLQRQTKERPSFETLHCFKVHTSKTNE